MADLNALVLKAGHEVGVGRLVFLNGSFPPWAAPAFGFAKVPEIVRFSKPQAGLWLGGCGIVAAGGGGIVRTHDKEAAPTAEVAQNPQVGADGSHTPDAAAECPGRKLVKHAVVIEDEPLVFGFTDAWPFGLPFVIEGVACLGKAIGSPLLVGVGPDVQNAGGTIPAAGKDGVGECFASTQADEWLFMDDGPFVSIEFGQSALGTLALPISPIVLIATDDDFTELTVNILKMWDGSCVEFVFQVGQLGAFECADVEFEQLPFHGQDIHFVRVTQVPGCAAEPKIAELRYGADFMVGVDHMWANDELVAGKVNEAVGVGSVDSFGLRDHFHRHVGMDAPQ